MGEIPAIGFAHIDAGRYHADPTAALSLSSSIAHTIVTRSPLHAWLLHPRLGGKRRKPSNEMDFGTLVHELVLGDGRGYVIVQADDWRTKKAQEAREQARADGKIAVLEHKLDAAREAAVAIMAQLHDRGVRFTGESEVAMFWQETAGDGTIVQCRGLADHLIVQDGTIYDLKTCESAHPDALASKIESYGYAIQAHAYTRALETIRPELQGRVKYRLLFAESDEPWAVTVAECAGTMRELGAAQWERAVNTWARCLSAGVGAEHWPGYPADVARVEAKPWQLEAAFAARFEDDKEGEAA